MPDLSIRNTTDSSRVTTAPPQQRGKLLGQYSFPRENGGEPLVADIFTSMTTVRSGVKMDASGKLIPVEQRIGVMSFVHDGLELFRGTISDDNKDKGFGVGNDYCGAGKARIRAILKDVPVERGNAAFKEICSAFAKTGFQRLA